jgi:hypothetical protein
MIFCFLYAFFFKFFSCQECELTSINNYVVYRNDSDNIHRTLFSRFHSFDQLKSNCSYFNITSFVEFIPKQRLILDNSFSLKQLFTPEQVASLEFLQFLNLKGFDIEANASTERNEMRKYTNLLIYSSKFEFYSNNNLVDTNKCDLKTYNNTAHFLNLFDNIKLVNTMYPHTLCSHIFKYSRVRTLIFSSISNSFLLKNRLHFTASNDTEIRFLKSLLLEFKYEILDNTNLNRNVFKSINFLLISGVLNEIESDTFARFIFLKMIFIQLDNLKEFFHASSNKWMSMLNGEINVNMSDVNLNFLRKNMMTMRFIYLNELSSFSPNYEYPNEDLCLFKFFPHNHAVFPLLMSGGLKLKCTCTIYWLHLYGNLYRNILNSNLTFLICNQTFNLSMCGTKKRLDQCDKEPFVEKETLFERLNDTDILFFLKWLQFILLTILQPTLCIMGIINNLLNLMIIGNRTKKKVFNQTMYRFIEIHSIFNILYCSVMCMKLINTCIFDEGSVFCSSIYKEDSSQYFKIVFIFFLGNSFKLASNVSYLLFSLSRLILVTFVKKTTTPLFKKQRFARYVFYFLAIFATSCLLSVFKLFQYNLNFEHDFRKDFPFEIYNQFYCDSSDLIDMKFKCNLFRVFKVFNSILNDILLVILNLIIDVILLGNFHRHLNNKLRQIIDMDHHKNIQKSKTKVNRMILFNGLLYVFSHLPEFVVTLLLVVYSKKISNLCQYNFSCDLVSEEAEFFCLISIVCQFYIFKVFDKNFKENFRDLKHQLLSMLTCKKFKLTQDRTTKLYTSTNDIELKKLANLIGNGLID